MKGLRPALSTLFKFVPVLISIWSATSKLDHTINVIILLTKKMNYEMFLN